MADLTAEIRSPTIGADVYRATLPGGASVEIGDGLKLEDNVLSVDGVLTKFSEDDSGNLMYNGERIVSVPPGGAEGETLTKQSDKDYDFDWKKGVTLEYTSGVLSIF